jgi:hypothetical protein
MKEWHPQVWKAVKLPGRNEPCVCGSGKKFKKCCLPKIAPKGGELLPSYIEVERKH